MNDTLRQALSVAFVVTTHLVLGAMLGGTVTARMLGPSGDGWTDLANFLGGLMVGGVAGLIVGCVLPFVLGRRTLWRAGWIALAASAAIVAVLWATTPKRQASPPLDGPPGPPTVSAPAVALPDLEAPPAEEEAAPSASPPSPSAPTTTTPWRKLEAAESRIPCDADGPKASVRLAGDLRAGETFRRDFGAGWVFEVAPRADAAAWTLQVVPATLDGSSNAPPLTALTPPLRGPRPLEIVAWHFLDREASGWNRGEVNAPQRLRLFTFSPAVPAILARDTPPTPDDLEAVGAFGRGAFEILELEFTEPSLAGEPQTARLERLRFAVCLSFPRSGAGSPNPAL